jgi:hypothetical protein
VQAVNQAARGRGRLLVRAQPVSSHRARALGENTLRWRRLQVGGGEADGQCDAQRNPDKGKTRVVSEKYGTATKSR